jgi:VanZ family protein
LEAFWVAALPGRAHGCLFRQPKIENSALHQVIFRIIEILALIGTGDGRILSTDFSANVFQIGSALAKSKSVNYFSENWSQHLRRVFQVVAWLLVLSIIVLSLVPPTHRPVTNTSQGFEHLSIFLAMGLAFGLGYQRRFWFLTLALVMFSGGIELAQLWVPGRHARPSDFLLDATASCVGIGLSFLILASKKIRAACFLTAAEILATAKPVPVTGYGPQRRGETSPPTRSPETTL